MNFRILPSLLAADPGRLAEEIVRARDSGADALHIDIMDPHFVPNISYGPDIVALARRVAPGFHRNVHLMMSRPDLFVEKFAAAGAQTIQIHAEAECGVGETLDAIRRLGARRGLAVNPETPVEAIFPHLGEIDEALVMTVHPGYGGQKFIEACLPKIERLRERAPGLDIMIDGGANRETIVLAAKAGADMFVAGSHLFGKADMAAEIGDLRRRLEAL